MGKYGLVKELLTRNCPPEQMVPQDVKDWKGSFPLPEEVLEYYRELGPCDMVLEHIGDPFFMPSLAGLWEYQAGYRYHPDTKKAFSEWNDDWLVIADEGADPFIFSRSTGQILHDMHGGGSWEPKVFCKNIQTMITVFATVNDVVLAAGDGLVFEENGICKTWHDKAAGRLAELFGSEAEAKGMLSSLGWGEWR